MRWFRTWSGRFLIGVALGVLIVLGWVRREAHIAETPRVSESGISESVNQEVGEPYPPSPPLPEGRGETKKNFSPSDAEGEREGVARTREGEKREEQLLIPRPSSLVTLAVPFVSQAPFRVWDLPYKEFCEEASVFTLHLWKQGKRTPPADELDRSLKDIQAWESTNLGKWEDTTAEETARVLREKFGYVQTWVVRGVTVDAMKEELRKGHPLVVPAAGRELSSPYYRPPGPLYHMLVVIGYDDRTREFITNDVGTNTKGAGFRFTYDDLYGAMGDWAPERGAPDTSQKVMIVVE